MPHLFRKKFLAILSIWLCVFAHSLSTVFNYSGFNFIYLILAGSLVLQKILNDGVRLKLDRFLYFWLGTVLILAVAQTTANSFETLARSLPSICIYTTIPLFWYFVLNDGHGSETFKLLLSNFRIIGRLAAILTIIQFYFIQDLWGLVEHPIYTKPLGDVTPRGISMFNSPQNNGTFLSLYVSISMNSKRSFGSFADLAIGLSAAILTGSKIAILTFILLLSFNFVKSLRIQTTGIIRVWHWKILIPATLIIYAFQETDQLRRFTGTLTNLDKITNYAALPIWTNILETMEFPNVIFGSQLGAYDRFSQAFFGYTVGTGSTESFVLKLFFEGGIHLLAAFLLLYSRACYRYISHSQYYWIGNFLIAFTVNLAVTPSFAGGVIAFLLWPLIVFGLSLNEESISKRPQSNISSDYLAHSSALSKTIGEIQ